MFVQRMQFHRENQNEKTPKKINKHKMRRVKAQDKNRKLIEGKMKMNK